MSAYMVANENLCKIAGYVTKALNARNFKGPMEGIRAYWLPDAFVAAFKEIPDAYNPEYDEFRVQVVHNALYEMNRQSLVARYGEEVAKSMAVYEPFDGKDVDTREKTREEWQCRLFTVLRNYLYQCSEGDVPDTPLFKAVTWLRDTLAETIAIETAKRDWGCGWSEWVPEQAGERKSEMEDPPCKREEDVV